MMRIHAVLAVPFGASSGVTWGLSIVILVVLMRLLMVPLFIKQRNSMLKMQSHMPQLQELRKKYKNDKQRLNEETMKFYKENGVNPLAGCLPMIPQMIIFFALFYVLRAIAEWKPGQVPKYGMTTSLMVSAQKATIFGVHLSDKLLLPHTPGMGLTASIVAAVTVAVSATTTFLTVRQTSKRGLMQTNLDPDNPMAQSQKYMMYIVPFFSLTGLYWQYGLVLYWVTTNLWTLGQQYFMFRNWAPPEPAMSGTAGTTVRTTSSSLRPSSGGRAKAPSGGARTATSNGRTDGTAPRPRGSAGSSSPGRQPSPRSQAATTSMGATGPNGTEKRGLLRLGKPKPEPEPEPEVPSAKVVRQQPIRQAKSKRSGKR